MTSRPLQREEKLPTTGTARHAAHMKDVKLKDRIHLFEGLSNQSGGGYNKNTSANNSEQARYPKVVSPEHKRWTNLETGMPDDRCAPPWLRGSDKADHLQRASNSTAPLPVAAGRTMNRNKTVGARSQDKAADQPMPTPAEKGQFTHSDKVVGRPNVSDAAAGPTPSRPDIIYVDGTPVKLRNSRKFSTDCGEERVSVLAMIKNYETKGDVKVTENSSKENGTTLSVTPADNDKNVEQSPGVHGEERRTKEESIPKNVEFRKLRRRRSKSVSDVHLNVVELPEVSAVPCKPQRTFEHDIYMETKTVIAQQERATSKNTNGLANPLYSIGSDEDDTGNPQARLRGRSSLDSGRPVSESFIPQARSNGRYKELPPLPSVPPYTPPLGKPRGQNSEVSTDVPTCSGYQKSPTVPTYLAATPAPARPHSDTTPVSTLDRQASSICRSFSTEDVSKLPSGYTPLKPPGMTQEQKQKPSEYAEPILPAGTPNEPEELDPVVDSEGYTIPGSHLWSKPKPLSTLKKLTSFHGKLSRNRKSSNERRAIAGHTYTEPGTHVADDIFPAQTRQRSSRLLTMRRKINDAFRRQRVGKAIQDDDRSSVTSEDSDGEVSDTVMHKRITHARAVKKRSSVYCNVDKYRRINKESKLYDYLVVVSLEFNEETRRYQPVEKSRYPEELSATQNDKLRAIPHFCFPDAFKWAPVEKYQSESYSFVLTSMDGSRLYGYNRRLLPPGDKPRLPEVYCIITPISCRLLFTQLLDAIETRRMHSKKEMEKLIREAYTRNVPPPGSATTIMQMNVDGVQTSVMKPLLLQRPKDSRLEHVDFDCLFSSLKIRQVIQIFASLLLERRVIMCSGKLSKLSKCSQAVAALLYPFAWQHVYVPVLPEKLIDMSCSPTPYIMGMLSLCIPKLEELPIDEVLIVDLDSKDFYTVVGDEETIIPRKLSIALERALTGICTNSFLDAPNDVDTELSSEDHEDKNRTISEIFIRYFVETCGHYVNHFSHGHDGSPKFDREAFIKVVTSRSIRRFLQVFTETQMFSLFIQEKEAESEGITQGLFEIRVREWEAECKVNANKFGAKFKKIGRAVKDISREGGKKVVDTAKDVRTKVKANLDAKV